MPSKEVDVPERQRAYRNGELVTIISGKLGKRGKVTIRNAFGFEEIVEAKSLEAIKNDDRRAKLKFGSSED
jgi:hypothetical protein